MPSIARISAILGARIEGIDLSLPLGDDAFAMIEDALHAHGFAVLPGQTLSAEQFVEFSRRLGRPEPHVIDRFHHPADPNILILSNVHRNGQPIGLVDAGTYFHTDYSYLDVPARCTILHSIQMPRTGSGTTFANQRQAYADLPAATRDRIERLVVRHHYGNREDLDEASRTVASVLTETEKQKVTWVRHPLVRRHPHTGVPCLYAVSGSSFEIEGMPAAEGRALLDELKAHSTQPAYCHTYNYGIGDVIVWDNVQLLHAAPLTDFSDARTLWRITVKEAGPTL
ncbi:MAG: TauD/TfdA family dioxygenase [Betaproteobacteria bacterium]|nr:TauD/TfdA family dioxygenase [Betaproteobacteria bacterium]